MRELILNNFLIKNTFPFLCYSPVVLWTSKGKLEVNFNIPLELRKIPSSMVVVGDVTDYIDVRLKGRQSAIEGISSGQISAHIDLSTPIMGRIQSISPSEYNCAAKY